MPPTVGLGLTLHANLDYLDLVRPLLDEVDYLEVTPETLWRWDRSGALHPNDYHSRLLAIGRTTGLPFVAHGIGLSLGALGTDDEARQARWLDRIRADHADFRFEWYTEHLGATMLGGIHVALPCPIPPTAAHARAVRRRLVALRDVVGRAGVENTAHHFCFGDPLAEPDLLAAAVDAPDLHLLLDLHNLHAMATNLGFDARAYLDRLPLERVIEVHLAGGGESNGAWLPSRRQLVLDGHDRAVPAPVWELLATVLPRCPALRGITLERMVGTLAASDVDALRDELRRARRALGHARRASALAATADLAAERSALADVPWTAEHERVYALALCMRDPVAALRRLVAEGGLPSWLEATVHALDPDGVRMTGLLIAKLRFERIINGSAAAARWFVAEPSTFAVAFRGYHRALPPIDHGPRSEAESFAAWCRKTTPG